MTRRARDIDDAAFGVIYGTITVMGVLAAVKPDGFDPFSTGLKLFVTVFAVALAKAYADLAAKALASGAHQSVATVKSVWHHSRTTLIAANGPTLAMFGAAAGFYPSATATVLAQVIAMAALLFYGWRIGWRISHRVVPAILSAAGMGGAGLALTGLKLVVH